MRNKGIAILKAHPDSIGALLLALAALALYLPSLSGGFVWDDLHIIRDNENIRTLSGIPGLLISEDTYKGIHTGYYRPATYLSFVLDYAFWGQRAWGYHLTNALLHAASSALLYLLLCALLPRARLACLAAALWFALHPVNAESVNFLSGGRNTLLSATAMLSALLLHLRGSRRAALPLYCIAVFSKEFALLLPAMIYAWYALWPEEDDKREPHHHALPYALIAFFYLIVRQLVLGGSGLEPGSTSLLIKIGQAPVILLEYLRLLALPYGLATPRQFDPPTSAYVLAAFWGAFLALALGAFALRKRTPQAAYGALWVFLFFLPVSNVIELGETVLAERYIYFCSMGGAMLVASAGAAFTLPRAALAALGALYILFAHQSLGRTAIWKDNLTLYTAMVKDAPRSSMGYHNLGVAHFNAYDYDRAIELFKTASTLKPEYPEDRFMIAALYRLKGQSDRALAEAEGALALNPEDPRLLILTAQLLREAGRQAEAEALSLRLGPEYAEGLARRARLIYEEAEALRQRGQSEAALRRLQVAELYMPTWPEPAKLASEILDGLGRHEEAALCRKRAEALGASAPLYKVK